MKENNLSTWRGIPIIAEIYKNKDTNVFAIEGNIIVSHYKNEIDLECLLSVNTEVTEYTKGVPVNHLFIACPTLQLTEEASEFGRSEKAHKFCLKSAVVCNNLAHKIIGNFLVKTKKLPRPTKMFTEIDQAIEWLHSLDN